MATRQEKLTIVVAPDVRDALQEWATQERRPVANLVRKIVVDRVEGRRQ